MLSDIEVTYFRSRIGDVLKEERLTEWQRQFLRDMQEKIRRYGTRTRLSEKQLEILKRLTRLKGDADLRLLDMPQNEDRRHQYPQRRAWRRSRRRWRYRDIKIAMYLVIAAIFGVGVLTKEAASPFRNNSPSFTIADAGTSSPPFTITDGDTVRLIDGTPVRLVGFNTPEKFEPMCEREGRLGQQATARLRELVQSGKPSVTMVPCACAPGTEGTKQCNFGRSCGILRVDGKDVGQTLISEGLAAPFRCSQTSCPPLPRPWCTR